MYFIIIYRTGSCKDSSSNCSAACNEILFEYVRGISTKSHLNEFPLEGGLFSLAGVVSIGTSVIVAEAGILGATQIQAVVTDF